MTIKFNKFSTQLIFAVSMGDWKFIHTQGMFPRKLFLLPLTF